MPPTTPPNDLADDILAWIDNWNNNPKPFIWHKTAEDILDRLGSYGRAITKDA